MTFKRDFRPFYICQSFLCTVLLHIVLHFTITRSKNLKQRKNKTKKKTNTFPIDFQQFTIRSNAFRDNFITVKMFLSMVEVKIVYICAQKKLR